MATKIKLFTELKNKKLKKYIYEDGFQTGPSIRIEGNEDYFIQCRGYHLVSGNNGWYNESEVGWLPYSLYHY